MFEPDDLLLKLTSAEVEFVVIGGVAVGVHGFARATKDLDIVPAPDPENMERLARALSSMGAQHIGVGDFSPEEFPFDPTDPVQLADTEIRVCALDHLLAMKRAAGRPQDLEDLRRLGGDS
jgi:hypothetical protein